MSVAGGAGSGGRSWARSAFLIEEPMAAGGANLNVEEPEAK